MKVLSEVQINAYDDAIEMAKVQSEALLLAANKIADEKKRLIDENTRQIGDIRAKQAVASEAAAKKAISEVLSSFQKAQADKQRLTDAVLKIQSLSGQLETALVAMKEAQLALDAYLTSEQVGEAFLGSVLDKPSVSAVVRNVTDALGRAKTISGQLSTLLGQL